MRLLPLLALVTARAARDVDEDMPLLLEAFAARQQPVEVVAWDDDAVDWTRYRLALIRSTWGYAERLPEFLAWATRVAKLTRLENPLSLVRWNVDKHYLADLAARGVDVVPSRFVEPAEPAERAVADFLRRFTEPELVVKPCVGAGSRDAQRHARGDVAAIVAHTRRLLEAGRSVLLQPYQQRVDTEGETALIHFNGRFSHAIGKAALLERGKDSARALYARVDLLRDADGAPTLLELELTEPSLFFDFAPGSAERLVDALLTPLA